MTLRPAFPGSLTACLALALAGCLATGQRQTLPPWPPLRQAELGEMNNVAVSAGIWIGSQPCAADLDLAFRRRIRRVISLCAPGEEPAYDLAATCQRVGLECYTIGPRERGLLDDECVDRALALLGEDERESTLMFCPDGSRAAAVFAIHRVVHERMPLDEALLEARRMGLRPDADEVVTRHVDRLMSRGLAAS
jgi:protein tyrosine phosphatase (PTP) superfamily phosphohydrolase (DUF442 family)